MIAMSKDHRIIRVTCCGDCPWGNKARGALAPINRDDYEIVGHFYCSKFNLQMGQLREKDPQLDIMRNIYIGCDLRPLEGEEND